MSDQPIKLQRRTTDDGMPEFFAEFEDGELDNVLVSFSNGWAQISLGGSSYVMLSQMHLHRLAELAGRAREKQENWMSSPKADYALQKIEGTTDADLAARAREIRSRKARFLLSEGLNQYEIARALGVDQATISRDLRS